MERFTVVISDAAKHDKGFRGTRAFWSLASRFGAYAELGLFWFLAEYFGRSRVSLMRPSQLLERSRPHQTDWLFVGLPNSLSKAHLRHVKYRRLVLYDSTDLHGVNFGDSDTECLLSETNTCLKNFRDRRWDFPYHIGFLPIKRPPFNNRLHTALVMSDWKKRFGQVPEKRFDVGFVARPTGTIETNQRLRWMVELKRDRPDLTLWGGLVGGKQWREAFASHPDATFLESCWLDKRKIGFFSYFAGLCQSRVALAPSGYAPWTYRHFEAIYAHCMVVSNDLSHFEFLIPFPREGMVEVADGGSVVPAIEKALEMRANSPEIIDDNLASLNRWLDAGLYSKNRQDTLDRFMAELEER